MNTSTPAPEVVRFGEFVLDMRSGELASHGRRVLLSDQPFRLLAILIRERGNLVTRETLQHQLWSDDTFVDFEAGLNAAMKRLREALGDQAGSPSFVETLPRRGYRFIAHVEEGPIAQPPAARTIDAKAPEAAPPPTAPPRGRLWLRGRAGLAFALAGALVLTAAAALVVRVLGSRSTPGVDRLPVAEPGMTRVTNLGTVLKASLSPDGRDLAYVRGDGVQESLWVRHGDAEPTSLLGPLDGSFASLTFGPGAEVYYTFFSPDKTNMALYRLPLPGGPPVKVLDAAGGIAFSPDGSRYAYIHNRPLTLRESRVMLVDTRSASTRVLTVRRSPESFVLLAPGWSPDGTRLAVFGASEASPGRHEIISLEVDNGAARPIPVGDLAVVEGAVWLPGGRELIVAARERRASPQRLWSVSLGSGALRPLTTVVSDYTLVGVTGDGTHLLAIRLETTRSLWTAEGAHVERAVRVAEDAGSLHQFDEVAWAPDGQLLCTLAESGNADIWSIDPASRLRRRLTTRAGDDFQPCVSPDGRMVVFASTASGTPGLWLMSRDGSNLRRLTTGNDTRPSFSPDGAWVAFQREGVHPAPWTVFRVWLQTGEVQQITAPPTMRPTVSPDGRFVAHYRMLPDHWALSVSPVEGGLPTTTIVLEPTHASGSCAGRRMAVPWPT